MNRRIVFPLGFVALVALVGLILLPVRASAHAAAAIDHGGTYFGDHIVPADQIVQGDVTVYFGDLDVYGTVNGNVHDYFGNLREEDGSEITGDTSGGFGSSIASFVPFFPSFGASQIAHENARLMTRLAYSVIVVLIFLIFPMRVRVALDRVEKHPGLSAAVGVVALIAVIPIAIVLAISLVGIPLIPVEFLAIFAGILIGQAALGVLIGRRVYELVRPHGTPSPLAALVVGLVVLSAAEILPHVGALVTGLVWLVGLGAAILAFIREFGPTIATAPGRAAGTGFGPGRPPIGGPPMATG